MARIPNRNAPAATGAPAVPPGRLLRPCVEDYTSPAEPMQPAPAAVPAWLQGMDTALQPYQLLADYRLAAERAAWEADHPGVDIFASLPIREARVRSLLDSCAWHDCGAFAAAVTGADAHQEPNTADIEAL